VGTSIGPRAGAIVKWRIYAKHSNAAYFQSKLLLPVQRLSRSFQFSTTNVSFLNARDDMEVPLRSIASSVMQSADTYYEVGVNRTS
jgi:hypothetical protein